MTETSVRLSKKILTKYTQAVVSHASTFLHFGLTLDTTTIPRGKSSPLHQDWPSLLGHSGPEANPHLPRELGVDASAFREEMRLEREALP